MAAADQAADALAEDSRPVQIFVPAVLLCLKLKLPNIECSEWPDGQWEAEGPIHRRCDFPTMGVTSQFNVH